LVEQAQGRLRLGETAAAIELLQQALALEPRHGAALGQLGLIAQRSGRPDLALSFLTRAADAEPSSPEAQFNLGLMLQRAGRLEEADAALRRAIRLGPDLAAGHLALAHGLHLRGRLDEAAAALERTLDIDPAYAGAWMNLGNVRREQGRLAEAERAALRALELNLGMAAAWRNLAVIHRDQGRATDAIAAFDEALKRDPDFADAQSGRLFAFNYLPDISAAGIAEAHRAWGAQPRLLAPQGVPHANDCDPERRLRVGYVSPDLHDHPVGFFLARVLESHDPAAIEAVCYATGGAPDPTTARLRAAACGWRDIPGVSDEEAERIIRADGIDILVDLSGHASGGRLPLFARRPAPVQASWLGYVSTTGLAAIDYLITDHWTAPEAADALFTEKLVRLPHGRFCYTPPAYAPEPALRPRRDRPLTFGSFNDLMKLNDQVIGAWARVLAAVPGSRLRLKWASLGDEAVRERLRGAFAAHGMDPARLVLSPRSPHAEMLAEYAEIDVALDPFPFCGGLTTCEALWMGAPVVTWPQERPASRQSLAFLELLGLGELAAGSEDAYVETAAALARDPDRLAAISRSLRPRMTASPLCRGELFTPTLEAALRGMWRRWCAGEPPAAFEVPA
jgi:predicted O-linked N-acetylglucosamine transferase (SPINDLY family)